jgi:hypothetical protein
VEFFRPFFWLYKIFKRRVLLSCQVLKNSIHRVLNNSNLHKKILIR